jgi:hypothetical protein
MEMLLPKVLAIDVHVFVYCIFMLCSNFDKVENSSLEWKPFDSPKTIHYEAAQFENAQRH